MTDDMNAMAATVARLARSGPVAVDPDLADAMGAFEETALSLNDALDAALPETGGADADAEA